MKDIKPDAGNTADFQNLKGIHAENDEVTKVSERIKE